MTTVAKMLTYMSKFALPFALFTFGTSAIVNMYYLYFDEDHDSLHLEKNLLIPSTIISLLLVIISVWGIINPKIFFDIRILGLTLVLFVSMFGIGWTTNIRDKIKITSYAVGALVLAILIWIIKLKGLTKFK